MCTAMTCGKQNGYFGRNLDLECSYGEEVVMTPRKATVPFRFSKALEPSCYAMIGVACVQNEFPLYYDAVNEAGLAMAGLNFPLYANYQNRQERAYNIAPFEVIPWVLRQCASVQQAQELLKQTTVIQENFSVDFPVTPLHWMLADSERALVLEPMKGGLKIYENPVGVLTNSPPFPIQKTLLCHYLNVTCEEPESRFSAGLKLAPYSRGMGAIGLPGDLSSTSRFVRGAFMKQNAVYTAEAADEIGQCFHLLDSVAQIRGSVHLGDQNYEKTVYSSCCDLKRGIYYYTTYENRQITAIDLRREDLDGSALIKYPMMKQQQIRWEQA